MSITVTVHDQETDEEQIAVIGDGDYLVICTEPATESLQTCANGTHVITIKGRLERCSGGYHTIPHKGCILR